MNALLLTAAHWDALVWLAWSLYRNPPRPLYTRPARPNRKART